MESVSRTIYSLFRSTPSHSEWVVACLQGAWSGILGDRIASACRPALLHGSELIVEVTEKEWLGALSSMREELIQRIRQATGGEVRQLTLKTGRCE